jgi:hypothetical protein
VSDGEFAGRLDDAIREVIAVTPSIMPVTRVLAHRRGRRRGGARRPAQRDRGRRVGLRRLAERRPRRDRRDRRRPDPRPRPALPLLDELDGLPDDRARLARGKEVSVVTTESRPTNEG